MDIGASLKRNDSDRTLRGCAIGNRRGGPPSGVAVNAQQSCCIRRERSVDDAQPALPATALALRARPAGEARRSEEKEMIKCPFNYGVYREDYNILMCRPKDELTADKMNDIAICRECIIKAGLTQVDRFHDLTDITSVNLRFDDVYQICHTESMLRKNAKPIKACYLVPNTLLYGTIRMYQTLIEACGVEVHVSYDINELAGILGVEKSVLISEQSV